MTNRELIKFLKDHQDDPKLGGGFSHKDLWNDFAKKNSDYGFEENSESFKFTWKVYLDYLTHIGSKAVLRPVGAALMAFMLVFGGWVTTVNASFGSVPGDFLYPVKLVTERTQLMFTANSEQRARLHAEFAGRRLDEALDIASSTRSNKDVLMKTAVENFRIEVVSVTDELKNVSSAEGAAAVTDLANAVDRKAEEYSAVIGQSSGDVVEVTAVVVEAQEQVTKTVVTEHEEQPQKETEKYLDTVFQKDIVDIRNRVDMINLRLNRIETALLNNKTLTLDLSNTIKITRTATADFDERIQDLSSIFAAGGYRTVFAKISEMKIVLVNAETVVADLEIVLTAPQQ
ncbi:MAG: hypothetical protein UX09_C0002G0005 [Candidatus Uhrbacteria bacterium GW2011_GWE2_45_35]|uniref:DUF5667 domain-containing protein n=2 Tax=Candidatus Uhriibacteriota TaxID=1752732 RepID=A0A0G1JDT5_9BACT|nr:MAG: hypothetical protein UW63_C0046G0004 [Candidatus Uhrbacteria bacterium GW2011_GWF2_44_350]KKU09162.1 MAG: hypothetical protein UX09_C0002G0005 [Candidatus Uhrbacteria bacterium GW2011_GWE2_45_35]